MMRPYAWWSLVAASCCAAVFIALALVASGSTPPRLDRTIEDQVHRWVVAHPPWPAIGRVAGLITAPLELRLAALLIAVGLVVARRPRASVWLVATLTLSGVLEAVLKLSFARPRPTWSDPIALAGGYSFPSGHALNSAAAAGCVLVLLTRLPAHTTKIRPWTIAASAGALLCTVAAGIDRVIIGVHYPSDVLAGWAAGACLVLVMSSALAPTQEPAGAVSGSDVKRGCDQRNR